MMKARNIFQLELINLFAEKRTLFLKFGFTLFLSLPFVLTAMPIRIKVSGLVILLLFTSFFGSAVALVRRRSSGHIERLEILPYSQWSIFGDFLLSSSLIDILQMALPFLLFLGIHLDGTVSINAASSFLFIFVLSVFFFNLLGLFLGFVMKSNPEVHLTGSLGIFFIMVFSGFIPVPLRLKGIIASLSSWSPAAQLVQSTLSVIHDEHIIQPTSSTLFRFGCLLLVCILCLSRMFNWRRHATNT